MRVATWNVNGVRARLAGLLGWLARARPDVVCLQETKVEDGLFPAAALAAAGYGAVWHGQKGYAGVAVLARAPLVELGRGLCDGEPDPEARLVGAAVGGLEVYSVYVPNGQAPGTEKFEWKLEYLERLRGKLHGLAGRPVVLAGDFNVAPADRDVWNPAAWRGRILCTDDERRGWARLPAAGYVDAVRRLHPEEPMFSWWDYRGFDLGRGLRIDHLLVDASLAPRLTAAGVEVAERAAPTPSDHAPVWIELKSTVDS